MFSIVVLNHLGCISDPNNFLVLKVFEMYEVKHIVGEIFLLPAYCKEYHVSAYSCRRQEQFKVGWTLKH